MNRSYLFVPGDSERKLTKASQSDADVVIIDLEDGVAPSQKDVARDIIVSALDELDFGDKIVLVRINAIETPFAEADVTALLPTTIDGIVLPKLEHVAALETLANSGFTKPIYGQIESALGVMNLYQLVTFTPRLAGLLLGAEDYIASIGAQATSERDEILFARSAIVNAAAAVEIPAIDTVYTDFRNVAGMQADTAKARQLGFSGKCAIHPAQVDVINAAWAISEEERANAVALLAAYDAHLANGTGVFEYNGKMIDEAVIRRVRGIL